jgi:SSS family solute:Na+ symporter
LFQFFVAFGTGVTVYGIALVLQTVLEVPFWVAVVLLGVVTIIYDTLGGIRGVIWSDVIQMVILVFGIGIVALFATNLTGGLESVMENFEGERLKALDFAGHGLGDGATFSFLPMLFGGLFLYVSYYGTNQTQVQRQLSTGSMDDAFMSLFVNGIARFPVVLGYCFVGVAIGAFAATHGNFLGSLPTREVVENGVLTHVPNFNAAVPVFVLDYLPHGVIGLIIIALFAAAMSSLDSTLNSLSATSVRDIIDRYLPGSETRTDKQKLFISKGVTVFWGTVCVVFSFFVANISDSIIVSINKIGSAVNGPILAAFLLAIVTRRATDKGVIIGIVVGMLGNIYLWLFVPGVSWLWWNAIGCGVTFLVGYLASLPFRQVSDVTAEGLIWSRSSYRELTKKNWNRYFAVLAVYFLMMVAILALF